MTARRKIKGREAQKPVEKSRRTHPGRIRELAATDIHAAIFLASNGREATGIERQLNLYFDTIKELRQIESGKKTPYATVLAAMLEKLKSEAASPKLAKFAKPVLEGHEKLMPDMLAKDIHLVRQLVKRDRDRFCKMFIDALDSRDSKAFFEVGKAIDRLNREGSQDKFRSAILDLKRIAELTKTSLTIREVAYMVGWPQSKPRDGFSQLRRLCKDLEYPLANSTIRL